MTQEQKLRRRARKRTPLAAFQKWIRHLFEESGLTEKAFAEWIGAAQSVVHNWLDGSSAPSAPQLLRLREVFTCPIDAMFGFEAPKSSPSTLHDVLLLEQQAIALVRRRLCAMGHAGQFDAWIAPDLPPSVQEELRQTVRNWGTTMANLDYGFPDVEKSFSEDYFPPILRPGLDLVKESMQQHFAQVPVRMKLRQHFDNVRPHIDALATTLNAEERAILNAVDGELLHLYAIATYEALPSSLIWEQFAGQARPTSQPRRRGRPRKLQLGEND